MILMSMFDVLMSFSLARFEHKEFPIELTTQLKHF